MLLRKNRLWKIEMHACLALFMVSFSLGVLYVRYNYFSTTTHHFRSFYVNPNLYFESFFSPPEGGVQRLNLSGDFAETLALSRERSNYFYSPDYLVYGAQWRGTEHPYSKLTLTSENGDDYKVKAKLFGLNSDHWAHPYLISYRIKNKSLIDGLPPNSRFNLLRPRTRGYYTDALVNLALKDQLPLKIPYNLVSLKVPRESGYHLYWQEGFFTKDLIEQAGQRDGMLFTLSEVKHSPYEYQDTIRYHNFFKKKLNDNPLNVVEAEVLRQMLILRALTNYHGFTTDNLHFYLNPINERLYPIYRELRFEDHELEENIRDLKTDQDVISFLKSRIVEDGVEDVYFSKLFRRLIDLPTIKSGLMVELLKLIDALKKASKSPQFDSIIKHIRHDTPESIYTTQGLDSLLNSQFKFEQAHVEQSSKSYYLSSRVLSSDLIIEDKRITFAEGLSIDLNGFQLIIKNCEFSNELKNASIVSAVEGSIFVNACGNLKIKGSCFSGLRPHKGELLEHPSCITFYLTNVDVEDTSFSDNLRGDDLVNCFQCEKVRFSNCTFQRSFADALDCDFCGVEVVNSNFSYVGNDAIDTSGTRGVIDNCQFRNVGDKAISAGENSSIDIEDSTFDNCAIGLVVKDGAVLSERRNVFKDNQLNFSAFQKKWQYYPPSLSVSSLVHFNRGEYLIQTGTRVDTSDFVDLVFEKNVEERMYGTVYGKSSK